MRRVFPMFVCVSNLTAYETTNVQYSSYFGKTCKPFQLRCVFSQIEYCHNFTCIQCNGIGRCSKGYEQYVPNNLRNLWLPGLNIQCCHRKISFPLQSRTCTYTSVLTTSHIEINAHVQLLMLFALSPDFPPSVIPKALKSLQEW